MTGPLTVSFCNFLINASAVLELFAVLVLVVVSLIKMKYYTLADIHIKVIGSSSF